MIISVPEKSYGILKKNHVSSTLDLAVEEIKARGFALLDSGLTCQELEIITKEFELIKSKYHSLHGVAFLKKINEFHTIRAPLAQGSKLLLNLAMNEKLMALLSRLVLGRYILSQQNGVINPPNETYSQSEWHRDLPYQHFVSSTPLAINALFCVDDFTINNGATYVLPGSHKSSEFPSDNYVKKNAIQIEAKAGSFIVLDCMVFHAGGFNATSKERRAINHLYTIPYFKQQIDLSVAMKNLDLSSEERLLLGFDNIEHSSIAEYLSNRASSKN